MQKHAEASIDRHLKNENEKKKKKNCSKEVIASKKHDELQLFPSSRNQKTPHGSTSAMQSNAKHNFLSDRPTALRSHGPCDNWSTGRSKIRWRKMRSQWDVCPRKTIPRLLCNFRVYFSSNRGLYINNLLSLQLRKIHTNHINQCLLTASSTKDNPSDLV